MQIIPFSLPININHYNPLSLHTFLVYWNYQKSRSTDILYLDEKVKVRMEDNQERGFLLTGTITFFQNWVSVWIRWSLFFFLTLHSAGSCPLSCLCPNTSSKARCQCHWGLGAPRLPGLVASLPGTAVGRCLWEMGWPQDSALDMLQKFTKCKKFQSLNPGICQIRFVTSANFNLFVWKLCLR